MEVVGSWDHGGTLGHIVAHGPLGSLTFCCGHCAPNSDRDGWCGPGGGGGHVGAPEGYVRVGRRDMNRLGWERTSSRGWIRCTIFTTRCTTPTYPCRAPTTLQHPSPTHPRLCTTQEERGRMYRCVTPVHPVGPSDGRRIRPISVRVRIHPMETGMYASLRLGPPCNHLP